MSEPIDHESPHIRLRTRYRYAPKLDAQEVRMLSRAAAPPTIKEKQRARVVLANGLGARALRHARCALWLPIYLKPNWKSICEPSARLMRNTYVLPTVKP